MKELIAKGVNFLQRRLGRTTAEIQSREPMAALNVCFMTTLGVNVGDEFIREGVRAVFDRIGIPYAPFYVNKHDPKTLTEPHEDEAKLVTDKYWESDLFVQSGAPVYWHLLDGSSRSVNSEWHPWLWQERILAAAGARKHVPVFLNLGAGSCQPWKDNGDSFLGDRECREFAIAAGRRATVTTVRDNVAARILNELQVPHQPMCCPAFLAAARHRLANTLRGVIGINLMPLGAHYDLRNDFDREAWNERCQRLCNGLRRLGRLVFVCHDQTEADFAKQWSQADERIFLGSSWRHYLDVYANCHAVVANRVHGAVCAAGFGVPSIIMGNDTRAQIGEYLGLPIFGAADLNPEDVVQCSFQLLRQRATEQERLLQLQQSVLADYQRLLEPIVARAASQIQLSANPFEMEAA